MGRGGHGQGQDSDAYRFLAEISCHSTLASQSHQDPQKWLVSRAFLNILFDCLEAMRQSYSPCLGPHLISHMMVLGQSVGILEKRGGVKALIPLTGWVGSQSDLLMSVTHFDHFLGGKLLGLGPFSNFTFSTHRYPGWKNHTNREVT